jgi:hypothetical protein
MQVNHSYEGGLRAQRRAEYRNDRKSITYIATLLSLVLCACNRQPSPEVAAAIAAISANRSELSPTESSPHIRAVTPETVPFSDNKAVLGSFHVKYEIERPELLTKARLELRTNEYVVAYVDVPRTARGEADLKVDNAVAIGPAIKLQLQCPGGETNWLAIGALRPASSSALPRIENITPDSVPEESDLEHMAGGVDAPVEFSLWGAGFQPDCKAKFSVNNSAPYEARSRFWTPQQMFVYITRRPLYPFDWSNRRYLELMLVIERKAPDTTAAQHVYLFRKGETWVIPVIEQ